MKVNNITITFLVYFKDLINFLTVFQALRKDAFVELNMRGLPEFASKGADLVRVSQSAQF